MADTLNVLHIVLGLKTGGLENVVLNLIETYPPHVKPSIVCLEEKGELADNLEGIDIFELNTPPGINLSTIIRLVSLIKKVRANIIHTHNPSPHFYGSVAGFLARRPVIHTKHGRNFPDIKRKLWLNRIATFFSDKIIAVSRDAAEVCLKYEKINPKKVEVILNGVDTHKFTCPPDHFIHQGSSSLYIPVQIGVVARLSPEKDHTTLLRACLLVKQQSTEQFLITIIGDGPLREKLEKEAVTLGIETYVHFTGMRSDVPDLLQKLDIFTLCSKTEGISLTLLEAMATCLPVVASDVGGNPEVVTNGVTGFLVPPENPVALAEKLCLLINNPDLRRQMGTAGREKVVEKFSIAKTTLKYVQLYDQILHS